MLEMTPARRTKKLSEVRIEKASSQQLSSLASAVIPVKKMMRVRRPPPVIRIGTIRKSTVMISSRWMR